MKKKRLIGIGLGLALCASLAVVGVNSVKKSKASEITIKEFEKDGKNSYIGYGYDVVNSSYFNPRDVKKENMIFRMEEEDGKPGIKDTKLSIMGIGGIFNRAKNNLDKKSYYQDFYGEKVNAIKERIMGTLWFDEKNCGTVFLYDLPVCNYENMVESCIERKMYEEYNYMRDVKFFYCTDASWDIRCDDYYQYFTDDFIKDVYELESIELMKKYGTHLLTDNKYGGRAELNTEQRATESSMLSYDMMYIDNKFSNIIGSIQNLDNENDKNNRLSTGNGYKFVSLIDDNGTGAKIYNLNLIGGDTENANENTSFSQWTKTISDKQELIDVKSARPMWEVISSLAGKEFNIGGENINFSEDFISQKAQDIKSKFYTYCYDSYDKLSDRDKIETIKLSEKPVALEANKGFDKTKVLDDQIQALHEGYNVVDLYISNIEKGENGKYKSIKNRDIFMKFLVNNDSVKPLLREGKLPMGTSNAIEGTHKFITTLERDTVEYGKLGKTLQGMGKMAYCVKITMKNGQELEPISDSNVLEHIKDGTTNFIYILNGKTAGIRTEDIAKIKVGLFYTTEAKFAPNRYDIHGNKIERQDWLTEYELEFE